MFLMLWQFLCISSKAFLANVKVITALVACEIKSTLFEIYNRIAMCTLPFVGVWTTFPLRPMVAEFIHLMLIRACQTLNFFLNKNLFWLRHIDFYLWLRHIDFYLWLRHIDSYLWLRHIDFYLWLRHIDSYLWLRHIDSYLRSCGVHCRHTKLPMTSTFPPSQSLRVFLKNCSYTKLLSTVVCVPLCVLNRNIWRVHIEHAIISVEPIGKIKSSTACHLRLHVLNLRLYLISLVLWRLAARSWDIYGWLSNLAVRSWDVHSRHRVIEFNLHGPITSSTLHAPLSLHSFSCSLS
jgi:hypothetical protein